MVPTFFQYKGVLIEWGKEKLGVTIGQKTKEDALENMRKQLIPTMREGTQACIFLDKIPTDFKTEFNDDKIFNADKVFNYADWRDNTKNIWLPYVKEEENMTIHCMNKGNMTVADDFTFCICSQATDEDLPKVIEGIPHFDKMVKVVVS